MKNRVGQVFVLALGMAVVLSSTVGCAATRRNRSRDRAKVLEAENINMRQRMSSQEAQMRDAHAQQDAALAQQQALQGQLSMAQQQTLAAEQQRQQEAAQADQMRRQLTNVRNEIAAQREQSTRLSERYVGLVDRHKQVIAAQQARPPAPVYRPEMAPIESGPSLQAEALRRDLESQLRDRGVRDLAVEVRNEFGQERVAVVLPDSFPAGKASLAHNKGAVKAVVGLATLIKSQYAGSQVFVEGHTDSDPIRRSNWSSNEALSEARANAVRDLLSKAGVQDGQISTRGFGANRPLDTGSNKSSKSRNRRVEIFITPRG